MADSRIVPRIALRIALRIVGELQFSSTRKYSDGKKECYLFKSLDPLIKKKYLVSFKNRRKYSNNIYVVIEPFEKKKRIFDTFNYGKLIKILGQIDDFDQKYEVLFYKYHFNIKKQEFDLLDSINERIDLTDIETISIDPIGSKDIDDALSIIDDKIYIHIADPTSYLQMKPMYRFSTIYNKRIINMYNDTIGFNTCSLIEGEKRNAITFIYDIKSDSIINAKLSIVLLDRNISYDCDDLILTELRSIICEDSHEIIEKLMVAVNLYVGNLLSKIEKGIFRNYKIKDIEKLSRNEELNNHLKIIKGNSAEYSLTPERHEYLMIDNYCHFTSPLRRYIDTLNHLIFKKYIFDIDIELPEITDELIKSINDFGKRHRKLSKDKNLLDLQKKIGDKIVNFEGYIISDKNVFLINNKMIVFVQDINEKYSIYDKVNIIAYTKREKFYFYVKD